MTVKNLKDDKPSLRASRLPSARRTRLDIILSSTALNVLALALPIMILQVYDRIIPNSAVDTLRLLVIGVGIALILEAFFRLARSYITAYAGAKFEHIAGCRALGHTLNTDIAHYERESAGVYIHRFNAIDSLREFMSGSNILVFIDLPFAAIFLGMVWYIGGILIVVPLVLLIAFSLITLAVGRGLRKSLAEKSLWEDRRYNFLIEVLTGIHTVKGLALEAQMVRRYERLQETTAGVLQTVTFQNNVAQGLGALFSQMTLVCVAAAGSLFVIDNQLSIGGLAACTLLSGRALQPLMRAMGVWTHYQNIQIAKERVNKLLQLPQKAKVAIKSDARNQEQERPLNPFNKGATLEFRNVDFRFSENDPVLFEDLSCQFEPGSISALVGRNSTGKTSFMWLAMGLLPPSQGQILLDGEDISSLPEDLLHERIAYLPQNGAIFHGTIMENLTTFRKGDYIDEAMKLSEELGLHDVIHRLPYGYDTIVGDGAADGLPGGIRQRIAIARALVSRPDVILFDEANTSLDAQGDEILKKFLITQKGKSTVIMVSLRPSLLKIADTGYRILDHKLIKTPMENLVQYKKPTPSPVATIRTAKP